MAYEIVIDDLSIGGISLDDLLSAYWYGSVLFDLVLLASGWFGSVLLSSGWFGSVRFGSIRFGSAWFALASLGFTMFCLLFIYVTFRSVPSCLWRFAPLLRRARTCHCRCLCLTALGRTQENKDDLKSVAQEKLDLIRISLSAFSSGYREAR